MAKDTITVKELNEFLTECNELCRKAVFKAAKKLKKEKSFDNVEEFIEALGESKFPKKYRKEMTVLIDRFGDKLGAEEKIKEDLDLISDIPEELVGLYQIAIWTGECLPRKFKKDAKIAKIDVTDMFPVF